MRFPIAILGTALLVTPAIPVAKADSRAAYMEALSFAQAKVERAKRSQAPAGLRAASRPAITHQVGDSWDVAVWSTDSVAMRHTEEPDALQARGGRGGVFRYEVVDRSQDGNVEIKIRQIQDSSPQIDPRVEFIEIRLDSSMRQRRKAYRVSGESKIVSHEGMRAPVSYLELLPLDAPEIVTATRLPFSGVPEIPEQLREIARGAAMVSIDPSRTAHYEQDDFFGRSVEAIWEEGRPWPSHLKTSNGVAILLRASSGGRS